MFIKLTFANPARDEFWMLAEDIKLIQRNPINPLQTDVTTALLTPKGPMVWAVLESAESIAAMVNNRTQISSRIS